MDALPVRATPGVADPAELYDQFTDAVLVYSLDGTIRFLNAAARRLIEVPVEPGVTTLWTLFPDARGSAFEAAFARVVATGASEHVELHDPRRGRWYAGHLYRAGDAIWTVGRDVTDERRTSRRLRLLADSARAFAAAGTSLTGACEAIAARLVEELGDACRIRVLSEDRTSLALLGGHDRDPAARARSRAIAPAPADDALTTRVLRTARPAGDGARMAAPLAVGGELLGVIDVARRGPAAAPYEAGDLAVLAEVADCLALAVAGARGSDHAARARRELDDAAQALREREQQLRVLTDTLPHAVWMATPDGAIEHVNRQWTEITGLTLAQTRGDGWRAALYAEDAPAVLAGWARCVAEGAPYQLEHRLRDVRTGEARWHLVRATPLHDDAGAITGWLGTCTDVDVQRRAAEALRDADRRKDEFLAMLGHELRNPLAPIVTALELLRLRGGAGEAARELAVMDRQVRHLLELVDDLLDVSRITRGELKLRRERIDLADAITQAIEMASPLLERRAHQLAVDVPRGLELHADRSRIAQVFANLLTNAAKYTDRGGRIAIRATRDGDDLVVRVTDSGRGIAPSLAPKIFDLFVQGDRSADRAQGGLGLGLAIVRSLVELHGGAVAVASEVGRGTVFTVTLPSSAARSRPPTDAAARAATPTPVGRKILVVDDNVDAAILLTDLLAGQGHVVETAHDGPTALEVAARFAPEIALLDIGLPVMDGYELARRLREQPGLGAVRMIAVTGYGQEEDRRASARAGFEAHLVKPLDLAALRRLLRSPT